MSSLADYIDRTPRGKRVLIEYVLLATINDQPHHAQQLAELLSPMRASLLVNLIPWNPTAAVGEGSGGGGYRAPERGVVVEFQRVVQAGGVWCSVRQEMGQDVDGACGQLALKSRLADAEDAAGATLGSGGAGVVKDIEDMMGGSSGARGGKVASVRKRRVARNGEQVSSESMMEGVAHSPADGVAVANAERLVDTSVDWRRSFAIFLLPLLVIVVLSYYYR